MNTHVPVVLVSSLLLLFLAATEGSDIFPRFKSKRKNAIQIRFRNGTSNDANLPTTPKERIVSQNKEDATKEVKSLTVQHIESNQPSISFDGLNVGSLTGGLIPPVGLVGDIAGILAKAGFVSSFVATVLSSLLLPLQITDVILSIIAISMTIAYSMGVTRLSTLRSDTDYSVDNELPEYESVIVTQDSNPPEFFQISQSEELTAKKKKKKKNSDSTTVWNTVFEARSFSTSPFIQDLSQIVYNALLKYS